MTEMEILEQDPQTEGPSPSEPATVATEAGRADPGATPDRSEPEAARAEAPDLHIPYPEEAPEDAQEPAGELADTQPQLQAEEAAALPNRHGPQALTKLIHENEALKGFLDNNPRAKSQLYQIARRSGELADYQQVLPTLNRAKEAAQSLQQLQDLDRLYLEGSPQDFLSRLWEAQATTDPTTGQQVSSGVYERHIQYLHGLMLDALSQQAEQARDTKLQNAVEAVREALGATRSSPATGASLPELPLSIRRRLADAERAEAELHDLRLRRSQEQAEQQEHFQQEIVRETAERLDNFVRGLLVNTGLNEYTQRAVARDFIEQVAELANRDATHAAVMEELLIHGPSPEVREQLVAKALSWARQHAREVLEPIVRGAAEAARREQMERESARVARQRPEPNGGAKPADPLRPSVRDLITRRESSLKRRLSDREILDL